MKEIIEVFRTNVASAEQASMLQVLLSARFPSSKINFDLDDCDKVLRVAGWGIIPDKIIETLSVNGYQCHVME